MEGTKVEIAGKESADPPSAATYKQIPEADTEVEGSKLSRPKSVSSNKSAHGNREETDGAHEKMLPEGEVNLGHVKFIGSNERQNGDAKVDIGEIKAAFVGMGKEELMKYANDPFWIRLRWFLFISFWLLWAGMLAGAIIIIIASPKCAAPEPRTWWEQGPLTDVPLDTSAEKLTEIKNNGVQGVFVDWQDDTYAQINSSDTFLAFLQHAKEADVKVIVKLLPGTTARWFERSEQNDDDYRDFYIWADSKYRSGEGAASSPNNWINKDGLSVWKYSSSRNQYYYAPDDKPVLNFRNPKVVEEFSDVLSRFVDAGVAGVSLKDGHRLLVDENFKNDSIGQVQGPVHTEYEFYSHKRTEYLPDLGSLLSQWRKIVKSKLSSALFMLDDELKSIEPFRVNETLVIDLPKPYNALTIQKEITAQQLYKNLEATFRVLGTNWPLWTYSAEPDVLPEDVLETVTLLLPGATIIDADTKIQKELLDARTNPSIMFGVCERYVLANNTVFAYIRVASGNPGYIVALNPSNNDANVDFTSINAVSEEVTVQFISKDYSIPEIKPKQQTVASNVPMPPKSAIVLTYVPKPTK